ncbi:MAG: hypothetical protein IKR92_04940 [Alphaproteobacteria bacterium]|nr:hypothetical protein [Alphaproteobacteria bacterium]
MDKSELKQTLHDQFVPLEKAVENKLNYLQSDDVFNTENYAAYTDNLGEDDSLENAFNAAVSAPAKPMYQAPSPEEMRQMQQAPQPSYAEGTPTQDSISSHKQNMAARIAALRGISMPGDYLRGKR